MAVSEALDVAVEQDVVFGRGGERDLLCDIYRPSAASTKRTAVIHLHGGGFRGGSKAGARLARPLAERGYTCVSASYRVMSEAFWPAQIQDVKAAIRWTRAHAGELGVAPNNVVVLGYSAGARLALIAAGTQDDAALEGDGGSPGVGTGIAACVAFYGSGSLGNAPVLGPDPTDEARRTFTPLSHVRAGYPPTLLLHGTEDRTIAADESLRLYSGLREVKVPVELHLVEGVTHIFDAHADLAEASAVWIDLFLDRHVANPRTYPSTEPGR
ncbi:MAG: alpha/beta hydrolase [Chloroflexi bacterium]|nr:alpha/beta hydrolase [Chloroflexota bacterium]